MAKYGGAEAMQAHYVICLMVIASHSCVNSTQQSYFEISFINIFNLHFKHFN
jgi:hypothetical protein